MIEDQRHVSFDEQALGKVLDTRPATVRDVAYGEGRLFSAGRGTTRLEVFPRSGVTRLTAADMRVELFGTADAAVAPTGVEFHRSQPDQEASLTVLPGGGVVFTFVAGAEHTPPATTPSAETSDRSGQTSGHPDLVAQTAREITPDPTDTPVQPPTVAATATQPLVSAEQAPTPPRTARPAAGDAVPEPRKAGPEQAPRCS